MSLDQKPVNLVLKDPVRLDLNDYKLMKVLGEGAFGRVKLTKNVKNGKILAFKQLKKYDIIKFKQVDHLKNENWILFSLEHPFIVEMEGMTQNKKYIFLAMEFVAGGELFTYLRSIGRFPSK